MITILRSRSISLKVALSCVAALTPAASAHGQSPQDAVSALGFQRGHSYFSPEPFEHYDTISGNVLLNFDDLTLPGNAGRSLTFARTYNNQRANAGQSSRWSFGFPGMVMRVIEKPAPPPNYPFNDDPVAIMATTPEFEMADGSIRKTMYVTRPNAASAATMEVRSSDFYLYDRQFHFLKMPNGIVCGYDPGTARLINFQDQFGNLVELAWSAESVVVTQHLGNGQDREVTLALDAAGRVTEMHFEDRTWIYTYGHQMSTWLDITSVTLPVGHLLTRIQI